MHCLEVRGGNHQTNEVLDLTGLRLWVYCRPHGGEGKGGDVYYLSSCSMGRATRGLLADVSGHGIERSATALDLRQLMSENINCMDQTRLVQSVNRRFSALTEQGGFATALIWTFYAPERSLRLSNAGHPSPLFYRHSSACWRFLEQTPADRSVVNDIPLGILSHAEYSQMDIVLRPGDLLLCYSDALTDAMDRDGRRLGLAGLKQLVRGLPAAEPHLLIPRLLEELASRHAGNLHSDDATILLAQVQSEAQERP